MTEQEIRKGLQPSLQPTPSKPGSQALVIVRRFAGLPTTSTTTVEAAALASYCDVATLPGNTQTVQLDTEAREHLLCLEKTVVANGTCDVVRFTVGWHGAGIELDRLAHQQYLDGLGECFVAWVQASVDAAVADGGGAPRTPHSGRLGVSSTPSETTQTSHAAWLREKQLHHRFMQDRAVLCCQREGRLPWGPQRGVEMICVHISSHP